MATVTSRPGNDSVASTQIYNPPTKSTPLVQMPTPTLVSSGLAPSSVLTPRIQFHTSSLISTNQQLSTRTGNIFSLNEKNIQDSLELRNAYDPTTYQAHSERFRELDRYRARQALAVARATRAAVRAEEKFARKRVTEGELMLNMLRDHAEEVHTRLRAADLHIGFVRELLHSKNIPEISKSDDGGFNIYPSEEAPHDDPSISHGVGHNSKVDSCGESSSSSTSGLASEAFSQGAGMSGEGEI